MTWEKTAIRRIIVWLMVLAACFVIVAVQSRTAEAAINSQINFQGKLTNPDGTNVSNGTYSIVFSIYTVPSGGAAVWTETQGSVTIADGIFQVALGSVNTTLGSAVDFDSNALYLGVKVGTDAEMTPRVQLTASPYAFNSSKLGGLDSASYVQLAQGLQTDSSTANPSIQINKTGATAAIMDLQRSGSSVMTVNNDGSALFKNQSDSAIAFRVEANDGTDRLTVDTLNDEVIIGSTTTDNTSVLLMLDSYDTFSDAQTCGAANNQGGLYYNTRSNAVRACIGGAWEDMVSTAGLGLQLFGVVPDSGANPGDLASVTGNQNGPCKVSVGANTATVSWTACTAYSAGRKVIVAAGTAGTTNGVAGNFQHLCLTGTNGQPALSTTGAEAANLATVSMPNPTNPILCLADIRFNGANNTITQVYDTRTFTNTDKVPVSLNTAGGIGRIVVFTTVKGQVINTNTASTNNIAGVVVATNGAASATTVNAILAVNGPAAVKSITGTNTVNSYIFTSGTTGYALTATAKPVEGTGTIYNVLGNARTAWSGATACTANNDTCAGSILTFIDKR